MIIPVFFLFIASSCALPQEEPARILKYEFQNDGLGPYYFQYATSDGSEREEKSEWKDENTEDRVLVVKGSYSYLGPDGVTYTVHYTADEAGFHPEGDHIKVPPFVPWIKGAHGPHSHHHGGDGQYHHEDHHHGDDGQYHPEKHHPGDHSHSSTNLKPTQDDYDSGSSVLSPNLPPSTPRPYPSSTPSPSSISPPLSSYPPPSPSYPPPSPSYPPPSPSYPPLSSYPPPSPTPSYPPPLPSQSPSFSSPSYSTPSHSHPQSTSFPSSPYNPSKYPESSTPSYSPANSILNEVSQRPSSTVYISPSTLPPQYSHSVTPQYIPAKVEGGYKRSVELGESKVKRSDKGLLDLEHNLKQSVKALDV